jgi:hypothetical protein
MLQNESIRAVGNMGVNARGDTVNSTNKVIDKKSQQIQRQSRKTTNVSNIPAATSNTAVKQQRSADLVEDTFTDLPEDNDVVINEQVVDNTPTPTEEFSGGLAAAIAKAKTVNQERLKTPRELAREQGVKKI